MSEPYLGEIRMISIVYVPKGYASCNGQLLSVPQNTSLFSLLGTTYGGDGNFTFGLPDMRGRIPIGSGQGLGLTNRPLGTMGGTESVTLTDQQIPAHTHAIIADSSAASSDMPSGRFLAKGSKGLYAAANSPVALAATAAGGNPGNQPHENRMPYLVLPFVICIDSLFPPRP